MRMVLPSEKINQRIMSDCGVLFMGLSLMNMEKDEERCLLAVRFYNRITGIRPIDCFIAWAGRWADLIVERQDLTLNMFRNGS